MHQNSDNDQAQLNDTIRGDAVGRIVDLLKESEVQVRMVASNLLGQLAKQGVTD
jgi:hypothetical protein